MTDPSINHANNDLILQTEVRSVEQLRNLEPVEFCGLGLHLLADYSFCNKLPSTAGELERLMLATAACAKATVVTSSFHEFSPHGLSGVVVVAESHLAAHTWPEHQTVCVDFFTCSSNMMSVNGLIHLFEQLDSALLKISVFRRG